MSDLTTPAAVAASNRSRRCGKHGSRVVAGIGVARHVNIMVRWVYSDAPLKLIFVAPTAKQCGKQGLTLAYAEYADKGITVSVANPLSRVYQRERRT